MWMLRMKGGIELTEHEAKYWDNVPVNAEIQEFALSLHRNNQPPYIIALSGYDEICCATMANSPIGGKTNIVGRVIFAVKDDLVSEMTIQADGIRLKTYPRDKLELKPEALRRMVR